VKPSARGSVETKEAQSAPMWMNGPSMPMGSPPAMQKTRPKNLTKNVRGERKLGTWLPLRYASSSEMPEPCASGPTKITSSPPSVIMPTEMPTKTAVPCAAPCAVSASCAAAILRSKK